jgi:hypothetical protein
MSEVNDGMTLPYERTCRTCGYYREHPDPKGPVPGDGTCRQRPPVMVGFPTVRQFDWCAGWRHDSERPYPVRMYPADAYD